MSAYKKMWIGIGAVLTIAILALLVGEDFGNVACFILAGIFFMVLFPFLMHVKLGGGMTDDQRKDLFK